MSDIGGTIIMAVAEALTAQFRKGHRVAVLGGAALGAVSGAMAGLGNIYLLAPLVLLGAVVGAAVAGMLFPRPPRAIELTDDWGNGQSCGSIQQFWSCSIGDSRAITVLMENAIYSACKDGLQPSEVLDPLVQGQDPELPAADLIPLQQFEAIEFRRLDDWEIVVSYRKGRRLCRRHLVFASMHDRRDFFGAIERRLGRRLVCENVELDLVRATWIPGLCFLLLTFASGGVAWLASYWRAFPPPNPIGKAVPGPVVSLLTWAGPVNVLLVAAPLIIAVWGWLIARAVWPPRVYRLTLTDTRSSSVDLDHDATADPLTALEAADEALRATAARSERVIRVLNLATIPLVILWLVTVGLRFKLVVLDPARERQAKEAKEQEKLHDAVDEARKAVREGRAGEAFNRLFREEHEEFLQQKRAVDKP